MRKFYINLCRYGFLVIFMLTMGYSYSQVTVQIGSGTTTNNYYPIYSCYGYNYSQQIYTQPEISAAGGSAGTITKIRFWYNSGGTVTANWNNWTIYLGNTTQTALASTSGWIPTSSMTMVFSGIITPVAGGWNEITLSTPFIYDGTNIVVAVDENTPNYSCTAAWRSFTTTAAATPRAILYYSDGTNPDPAAPPTANNNSTTTRAQVQFDLCPDVLTAPTTTGQDICAGNTASLTATSPYGTINWYDLASGGTLVGTGSPFVTPVLANTTSYFAATVLAGCTGESATTEAVANVNPVLATLNPVNVDCNGGTNGSFTLGTVTCGTEPFLYSIDGGAYGAIPTDLAAGTYSVMIEDDLGNFSAPVSLTIGEPATPAITIVNTYYYSTDISWTTTGVETAWTVEYGPTGFVPGTGTIINATVQTATLTGLDANTGYDVYVTPACGPGSGTTGPVAFSTDAGFFTYDNACGPGFNDISSTGAFSNLGDDGEVGFTLPWTMTYQGTSVTDMTVGNNGGIAFGSTALQVGFTNGAMSTAATGLYPMWDDLYTNTPGGVYIEVVGTAPNRQAIFQWDVDHIGYNGTNFIFQVVIDEATDEVYYIYENSLLGSATYDYGASATIGASGPVTDPQVSFNSATYLQNNSCVHLYYALCPNPVNVTTQVFQEEVILDWDAGLYGETEWTLIYGPAGFDPLTEGTTISVTSSDANILGLTQITDYDVYIYSECTIDNLTSGGLLVSFQTLPWCNTPTGLGGTVAVDSLFATWSWTEVIGSSNPLSSFNIQYGNSGFDLYTANMEVATGLDYADTVENTNFLAGGVYQYYVQAVCGTDTSNYAGPFNFTMPLSNDTVCGAEMLNADGTIYTFNNTGASVSVNENTIAPPANGFNVENGWGNSTLDRTTWFTFVAPASGSVRVDNTAINYTGQAAVYDVTDCGDFATFALIAANDNSMLSSSNAPNFSVCGLTPGNTYYLMHDGNSLTAGNYSISITPIILNAGTFVDVIDVCAGSSVDLFAGITGNDAGGVWTAEIPAAGTGLSGSTFNSTGLAYDVFNFEYRMTDGCAYDSIIAQVEIWAPSSAGNDGIIDVCRNEPFDLLAGLSGNVDLGGTWYDPSNNPMGSSAITANNIPGQFNYLYIAGNGICPDDTALVLVNVSPSCDYLFIDELYFGELTIYPNPSNGVFMVSNTGSTEVFNYEVTDIDGRVIDSKLSAINGTSTTEVDLTGKVTGIYMIRVYNDNAEKVFRVVLQ